MCSALNSLLRLRQKASRLLCRIRSPLDNLGKKGLALAVGDLA